MTELPPMFWCVVPQTAKPAALVAGRREAALEPAPADVPGVEQVADVLAGRDGQRAGRGVAGVGAVVEGRVGVTVDRAQAGAVQRADAARVLDLGPARRVDRVGVAGLAGDQVERAGRGRAERGVPVVVAHRVVLRVVPQPGDRVAVVVVHDQAGMAEQDRLPGARVGLRVLDELVHLAVVDGFLLRGVAVVLVAGQRLGVGEPGGVVRVRVAGQQRADRAIGGDLAVQAVHRRGAAPGLELGPVGVGRERVCPEVVVERLVLVEEHHQVLDRRRGLRRDRPGAGRARLGHGDRARGIRRRVRARHRGADGDAGAEHDGGRDGGVVPGLLSSDTNRGWAFAHVRPPESAGCEGRRTPRGYGAAAPVRPQAHPGAKTGTTR